MKTNSIQNQLSHKIVLLTGFILFSIALISDLTVTHWLEKQYDESLISKAGLLVTLTKDMPDGIDFDFADEFMPEFERKDNPEYYQLWTHDNKVFERSHSLYEHNLERLNDKTPGQKIEDIILPDGRQGRKIQVVFIPQIPDIKNRTVEKLATQKPMTLVIAKERDTLNNLILLIHGTLVISSITILIFINLLIAHTIKKGLTPLLKIRDQIILLDADNLTSRLTIPQPPSELEDIIKQFNALLQRLEISFTREQQFTSDVAHELRTPIAEIRNMSEVALKFPEDQKLSKEFYQDVLQSSLQMQKLVVNLLALARSENGLIELEPKEFNLKKLILDSWQHYKCEAALKALTFDTEIPDSLTIITSYAEFILILNNLLSNAVNYSPVNGKIQLTLEYSNNILQLKITNETDDFDQDDIKLIFNRLWRKNNSRTLSSHSGLGLALVKSHAELLNLKVSAELVNHTFIIRLSNITVVH